MATWIRRNFDAAGITQIPAGPHLRVRQQQHGGVVVLMIDVSGSMDGMPILEAMRGAKEFVREAVAARYRISVMLWNTTVTAQTPPDLDGSAALTLLGSVSSAMGGNALDGPLEQCHRLLGPYSGDRVVALFGDGDLTPKHQVLAKVAAMKDDNIRFVTRGLGAHATREFAEITDEDPKAVAVESVAELASGIASMAAGLKK